MANTHLAPFSNKRTYQWRIESELRVSFMRAGVTWVRFRNWRGWVTPWKKVQP